MYFLFPFCKRTRRGILVSCTPIPAGIPVSLTNLTLKKKKLGSRSCLRSAVENVAGSAVGHTVLWVEGPWYPPHAGVRGGTALLLLEWDIW